MMLRPFGRRTQVSGIASGGATVIPQSGSFASVLATYQLTKIANRVVVTVTVVITTNGTAAGVIDVILPYVPLETTAAAEVRLDGKVVCGWVFNNGGAGVCRFHSLYDGTYAGGDGKTLVAQVDFRV